MKGNKEFKQECDQAIGSIANMPKAAKTDQTAKSTLKKSLRAAILANGPARRPNPSGLKPRQRPGCGKPMGAAPKDRLAVPSRWAPRPGQNRIRPIGAVACQNPANLSQTQCRSSFFPEKRQTRRANHAKIWPRGGDAAFPCAELPAGASMAKRRLSPNRRPRRRALFLAPIATFDTEPQRAACALARLGFARARAVALFSPRPARPTHRLAHESSFRIAAWRGDCGAAVDGLGRDP